MVDSVIPLVLIVVAVIIVIVLVLKRSKWTEKQKQMYYGALRKSEANVGIAPSQKELLDKCVLERMVKMYSFAEATKLGNPAYKPTQAEIEGLVAVVNYCVDKVGGEPAMKKNEWTYKDIETLASTIINNGIVSQDPVISTQTMALCIANGLAKEFTKDEVIARGEKVRVRSIQLLRQCITPRRNDH